MTQHYNIYRKSYFRSVLLLLFLTPPACVGWQRIFLENFQKFLQSSTCAVLLIIVSLCFSRNNKNFLHLKIVRQLDGQFILGQFSKPFVDIPKVIHHYSKNKLNIRGAEHKFLKHPVSTQPEYHTIEPEDDDGVDL